MNKKMIVLLATVFLLGFTNLIFSQEQVRTDTSGDDNEYVSGEGVSDNQGQIELIRGRVISIDQQKNQIVIDQDITHVHRTIELASEDMQYVTIGEHVKVRVRSGENKAESITRAARHHHHTPPQ
jgi:hypothetical protein